ncbi:hypothetical protein [Salinibacillus xinjiangensis]|uniref:Uncharacterized protein n=1 Tax=Salinibacillus xinjiangensis TaxID=1229268 RepID=A0A6G1X3I4_9BACI|nr:hypothetical protein [Salinibacillus xinjiangensis]MRG85551.1 hypothetical protein [Salinibacillus xinjiangensis]
MKTPQEAVWASEEAEAAPMESEVFCRNGLHALNIIQNESSNTKKSHYVSFSIY